MRRSSQQLVIVKLLGAKGGGGGEKGLETQHSMNMKGIRGNKIDS